MLHFFLFLLALIMGILSLYEYKSDRDPLNHHPAESSVKFQQLAVGIACIIIALLMALDMLNYLK